MDVGRLHNPVLTGEKGLELEDKNSPLNLNSRGFVQSHPGHIRTRGDSLRPPGLVDPPVSDECVSGVSLAGCGPGDSEGPSCRQEGGGVKVPKMPSKTGWT